MLAWVNPYAQTVLLSALLRINVYAPQKVGLYMVLKNTGVLAPHISKAKLFLVLFGIFAKIAVFLCKRRLKFSFELSLILLKKAAITIL